MRLKRIIQVSSYYPPHLGGQENAVRDLARQLANSGHDVQVLASTEGGGPKGVYREEKVHVRRLPAIVFGKAPIMPWFPVALFQLIKKGSIIHLHIGQAFTPEMVWLIARLRGCKYIAELHIDFEPSGPAGILLPLYKQLVLRRVLRSAGAVVVLNQKTLRLVRDRYGYTGIARVMSNGIDEEFFTLGCPVFAVSPPRVLNLLFVGRLSKQKNIPVLLKALSLTKRKVQLDIVGDGDELEVVKRKIRQYKLKNVTLRGRLSRSEVMEYYRSCDALIMPSLYEAQPLVLLEAMAARIPIIGTNVIGVQEHIKDVGIVVEPTAEGLAAGIEQYYVGYALLLDMVENGYTRAEKLRWKHTLKKYEMLYEKVLGD